MPSRADWLDLQPDPEPPRCRECRGPLIDVGGAPVCCECDEGVCMYCVKLPEDMPCPAGCDAREVDHAAE